MAMSESRVTLAPWEQVFQTPELALLILGYVELRSVYVLASTCRTIFHPTVAVVWKNAPNASPLFQLLPCTQVNTLRQLIPRYHNKERTGKNYTFSRSLITLDFERFSIYAPYITCLDLYKDVNSPITVSGWRHLLDYVNSGHVLLPNLTSLIIRSNDARRGMLPYPWVVAFASGSLLNLHIGWGLRVSYKVGSAILAHLTKLRIELNSLELHIVPEEMEEQDECVLPILDEGRRDYVKEYLESAITLKSLGTSSYLFNKYPHHIGHLPQLLRLKLRAYSLKEDTPIMCSRDSTFTSLQRLQLVGFVSSDVGSAWVMAPISRNITTLEVIRTHPVPTAQFDSDISFVADLSDFITTCLKQCLKLTVLCLDFDPSAARMVKIGEQTLRLLSQQPLRELSMRRVFAADGLENHAVQCVTSIFTNLEVLVWPDLFVPFYHLHHFIRMSKLKRLAVCIESLSLTLADMRNIPWLRGVSGNTELRSLVGVLIFWGKGSWFRFASYISHLWPNVQISTQEYDSGTNLPESESHQVKVANAYMELLRSRGRGNQRDRMKLWVVAGGDPVSSDLYF